MILSIRRVKMAYVAGLEIINRSTNFYVTCPVKDVVVSWKKELSNKLKQQFFPFRLIPIFKTWFLYLSR